MVTALPVVVTPELNSAMFPSLLGQEYHGGYLIDYVQGLKILGSNVTLSLDNLPVKVPIQAIRLYGCTNCEWKGGPKCRFLGKNDLVDDNHKMTMGHMNNICVDRLEFLKSYSSGYNEKPTFTQWQRDYSLNVGNIETGAEKYRKDEIQKKLDMAIIEFEDKFQVKPDKKEEPDKYMEYVTAKVKIDDLREELVKLKDTWRKLWEKTTEFADKQQDRETAKKVDMNIKKTLTLQDIHNVMAGEVIDAEVKESEDKQ
jgi:hypothetical protein